MRTLFEIDAKNYSSLDPTLVRPSARAIIIRDGKIALVYSELYDYYKFAGGGIEEGEDEVTALCREVREEIGLRVKKETVRPYGQALRKEKRGEVVLVQNNIFFLCDAEDASEKRDLDEYEEEEKFVLRWVAPQEAIQVNRTHPHGKKGPYMIERETRALELLLQEGYFTRH